MALHLPQVIDLGWEKSNSKHRSDNQMGMHSSKKSKPSVWINNDLGKIQPGIFTLQAAEKDAQPWQWNISDIILKRIVKIWAL